MTSPLQVVAAVIERQGQILIGQRKRTAAKHALKWEFPGGKVEAGETTEMALMRELREELAIEAVIGPQVESYEFYYPASERATLLLFFRVTEFSGEPQNLDFEQILWVPLAELPDYDFLEGDVAFVRRLAIG
ncbi:MAG: (deoxy)nucleoside triphosphate pyrophosphohydrolase [Bryobacteraceae bacterium]